MHELYCISLPTPFPVGPVNIYLAPGRPLTLIDTGPKFEPARAALAAAFRKYDCRFEDLEQIILTHHHVDHTGLTAELVARSGAKVFTHPYNFPWLADYGATRAQNASFYRGFFHEAGVPEPVVREIDASSAAVAQWAAPFDRAHALQEKDKVVFAQREWDVFHTPGHAGGLICLWEPRTRTLLANDHMLKEISSNAILEPPDAINAPRPKRLLEYLCELKRMAQLEPASVLPGHGEAFTAAPQLVEQRLSFHHNRAQMIREILGARALTLWQVTREMFPELSSGIDFFLGLSEVQGHLDLLAAKGEAASRRIAASLLWERRG